jgi:hypothetical protein
MAFYEIDHVPHVSPCSRILLPRVNSPYVGSMFHHDVVDWRALGFVHRFSWVKYDTTSSKEKMRWMWTVKGKWAWRGDVWRGGATHFALG